MRVSERVCEREREWVREWVTYFCVCSTDGAAWIYFFLSLSLPECVTLWLRIIPVHVRERERGKKKEEKKKPRKIQFAWTGIWAHGLCLQSRACYPLGNGALPKFIAKDAASDKDKDCNFGFFSDSNLSPGVNFMSKKFGAKLTPCRISPSFHLEDRIHLTPNSNSWDWPRVSHFCLTSLTGSQSCTLFHTQSLSLTHTHMLSFSNTFLHFFSGNIQKKKKQKDDGHFREKTLGSTYLAPVVKCYGSVAYKRLRKTCSCLFMMWLIKPGRQPTLKDARVKMLIAVRSQYLFEPTVSLWSL